MEIIVILTVIVYVIIILVSLIVSGGGSTRLHKTLIKESARDIGLNLVAIRKMFGYGNSFHYVALYLDEKNNGHAKECIVYKKTVYWMY